MPKNECIMPELICDDVLHWAETTPPLGAMAMLCDPPYELNFMSRKWDNSGIAFRSETWAALARHLLPGAFILAFASSRGWHRLACAMEDAGLRIQPSIFAWVNGQSFPKATRIDSAIDKAAGAEREVIDEGPYASRRPYADHLRQGLVFADDAYVRPRGDPVTAPTTPLAKVWEGHCYGGQILKNAIEPIIVAQVPYSGRPVDSITRTGAGALNIDAGRIAGPAPHHNYGRTSGEQAFAGASDIPFTTPSTGRWPPNFALCHLPTCQPLGTRQVQGTNIPGPGTRSVGYNGSQEARGHIQQYAAPDGTETVPAYRCSVGCPVAAFDGQAGQTRPGHFPLTENNNTSSFLGQRHANIEASNNGYGDSGSASRFFHVSDWSLEVAEQLAHATPVFYAAKASSSERSQGLAQRNLHPCIKPLSLCTWLASLLLPPAAYVPRRVLIPFCGTGSEMIGAVRAGWDHIIGIEQDQTYIDIASQRIAWWTGARPAVTDQPQRVETADVAPSVSGQLTLF